MTAPALIEAHRVNRAAVAAATRYDTAKDACRGLSDYDRAALAQWLIDQLDHVHDTIDGRVNIEDLKIEADGVIGDIVSILKD